MHDIFKRYWKVGLGQLFGFGTSWVLVTYVFLGPLPIIQPSFQRSVEKIPSEVTTSVKALPANMAFLASDIRSRLSSQDSDSSTEAGVYPPPFVLTVPVGDTMPVPIPLVTSVQTPTITSEPQVTLRPTAPKAPQQTVTPRVTRKPTLAQAPITEPPREPTSPPLSAQEMEAQTLTLINQRRSENGAGSVSWNSSLQQAARSHAGWVGEGPAMAHCSHQDANGKWPDDRARASGYTSGGVGEIIACRVRTPQEAVDGWMNSPRHKKILIDPSLHDIGIGWGGPYSVALFGG